MLLTEFFETSEGNSYAKPTTASSVKETKRKITAKNDPCWKGYHMVGTKSKDSKEVPNCVSGEKGSMNETADLSHIIQARQLAHQAMTDTSKRHEYFDFMKHLRDKHGKEYSIKIHQNATKLDSIKESIKE